MGLVLGVDPGADSGALAVVDVSARRVVAWWAYLEVTAGLRARGWLAGGPREWSEATLPRLAVLLTPRVADYAPHGSAELVLEGLFQSRRKGLLTLAESAGVWRAHLEPGAAALRRPTATAWRAEVLGLGPRVDAARAEEAAVRWARRNLTWEHPPDGLTRVEEGAVCEAAAMACSTTG